MYNGYTGGFLCANQERGLPAMIIKAFVPWEAICSGEIRDPMPELPMLPMFYLFPVEMVACSEFLGFPRNPYTVLESPEWMAVYQSLRFREICIDAMANMVWKYFGIKAPMEDHSGYFPFWILARIGVWRQIAEMRGYNTYNLAYAPPEGFDYPSFELAEMIFKGFAEDMRKLLPLDEYLKVVQEYPAHEDYEPTRKNRRTYINFLRKWYHTRSKWVKPVAVNTSEEWDKLHNKALERNPYAQADYRMDYEPFEADLSETDNKIIHWLIQGYTQAEIAAALGYANHSPVTKRIQRIGKRYRAHLAKPEVPEREPSPVKDNWDEMTRLLFLKKNNIAAR